MHEVWQTVLEETDRVGKVRLLAADTYLLQISEPCKPVRAAKCQIAKKVGCFFRCANVAHSCNCGHADMAVVSDELGLIRNQVYVRNRVGLFISREMLLVYRPEGPLAGQDHSASLLAAVVHQTRNSSLP
jgi:hypothetical protein